LYVALLYRYCSIVIALLRFCLQWELGFDFALFIENASHFRFSITTTLLLFVLLLLLLLLFLLADYYYFTIFLFSLRVCARACVRVRLLYQPTSWRFLLRSLTQCRNQERSLSLTLALPQNNAICCCLTRTFVVAFNGNYTRGWGKN